MMRYEGPHLDPEKAANDFVAWTHLSGPPMPSEIVYRVSPFLRIEVGWLPRRLSGLLVLTAPVERWIPTPYGQGFSVLRGSADRTGSPSFWSRLRDELREAPMHSLFAPAEIRTAAAAPYFKNGL